LSTGETTPKAMDSPDRDDKKEGAEDENQNQRGLSVGATDSNSKCRESDEEEGEGKEEMVTLKEYLEEYEQEDKMMEQLANSSNIQPLCYSHLFIRIHKAMQI
jgi:hypothetical protein